ncbi:protein indeterminate-domain 12-like isoform X1 [Carya illinoinensis]|uniref:protein indeterminate-domain 12-like isoform X1 n=1 Tax=Carya illinoinensis TaxID=32201 RepID=UPI001C7222C0|nr:protein indeterminate-domain 12-like isoform X1 [Carya illinoinensis]XP_042992521.1 protein indeterminate-domain 12-like isoform X1 [Carya illinoinensis]
MLPAAMSNSTSLSEEASVSSGTRVQDLDTLNRVLSTTNPQQPQKMKKKRSLPGNPVFDGDSDPDSEVIALSPKTLLATNRFVCEICNKGFQRDQNLQLHRRGHNLPWKLKQRNSKEVRKRAYVCPEPSCVHHHPSRALGDLTGIKKHYCRKHGEKKWKCEKCSKIYAVQSDWKAHSKTCGTREYRCDCGTLFSRKDSFITHRAFCDALAEESARLSANQLATTNRTTVQPLFPFPTQHFPTPPQTHISQLTPWDPPQNPNPNSTHNLVQIKPEAHHFQMPLHPLSSPHAQTFFQEPPTQHHPKALITSPFQNLHVTTQHTSKPATSAHLSATALLQKAATVGAATTATQQAQSVGHMMTHLNNMGEFGTVTQMNPMSHIPASEYMGTGFMSGDIAAWRKTDRLTRDFLGLTDGNGAGDVGHGGHVNVSVNVKDMLSFTRSGAADHHQTFQQPYERTDHTLLKSHGFGFAEPASETWGDC